MTSADLELEVLGKVKTQFTSFHFLHIQIHPIIKKIAYNRLLNEAKKEYAAQYGVDVLDIKNISIEYNHYDLLVGDLWYAWVFIPLFTPITGPIALVCDWQVLDVVGTVVINPNKTQRRSRENQPAEIKNTGSLENAIQKSAELIANKLPNGSVVAVLNISSTNNANFIIDELEYRLVEKGINFRLVERRMLAQIRIEEAFQTSGEVSDDSAVSMGQKSGATIVITGNVTVVGNKQRLTLKALDVKTGQIVAITREDF
jgi:hypothetical protein